MHVMHSLTTMPKSTTPNFMTLLIPMGTSTLKALHFREMLAAGFRAIHQNIDFPILVFLMIFGIGPPGEIIGLPIKCDEISIHTNLDAVIEIMAADLVFENRRRQTSSMRR